MSKGASLQVLPRLRGAASYNGGIVSVTISTTPDGQIVFKDQNGKTLGSFVAATQQQEDNFGLMHAAPTVTVAPVVAAAAPVAPVEPVAEPTTAAPDTPPPPPVVAPTNLPTVMQAVMQITAVLKSHGMVS